MGALVSTLLSSFWTLPLMVPSAIAAAAMVGRGSSAPPSARSSPSLLLVVVVAWPLVSLAWAVAFGGSPDALISPWHMRLLSLFLAIQAIVGWMAVRQTPKIGRARQLSAVVAVCAFWVGVVAMVIASLEFGGAPM